MRWVTYRSSTGPDRVGLVDGDRVLGLRDTTRLIDLIGEPGGLAAAADRARRDPVESVALADAELRAPIPVPPSIRDFMAFEEHVANCRGDAGVPDVWYQQPVFYFTNPAAVVGPAADVAIPPGSVAFDYEVEVAAVIGFGGSDIAPDDAERHIAGYTILVDWSARDLQRQEMHARLGPAKGKDSATTLGPWLVTPDELEPYRSGDGFDRAMRATVDGRPCTDGNWGSVHWGFADLVAYASRGTRLVTGDVLGSGTVGGGCILELSTLHGSDAYPWLGAGDEVHVSIEGLGSVHARIVPGVAPVPLRGQTRRA